MESIKKDLSDKVTAETSRNQTALTGLSVMNVVLCIAYFMEVVKGARTIGSYLIMVFLCIAPCTLAFVMSFQKKDTRSIRYILSIGFKVEI